MVRKKKYKPKRPKYRTISINPQYFERTQIKFYLVLLPFLLLVCLPVLYIVFSAFKPLEELFAYPPRFITTRPTLDNFKKLFDASENTAFPMSLYLFNSVISTLAVVVLGILISSAAAFSLSKLRFKGKNVVFQLNTVSIMFVATAVSIPRYLIMKQVGLLDTFWANIIPMLATPVVVFLLKQFIDQVPDALVEAARMDGASDYTILFRIVLPLIKPALATAAIILFQSSWNSMEASNLFINRESLKTFAFYMNSLSAVDNGVAGAGMAAAATLIIFVPNIVLFVIMQSRVMDTMAHSGLK